TGVSSQGGAWGTALQCGHGRGTVDDLTHSRLDPVSGGQLQCGHGRGTVDDCSAPKTRKRSGGCFNVATVVGPWMTCHGVRDRVAVGRLQCGNGRGTVDDVDTGGRYHDTTKASMWPRSWDRG